MLSVLIGKEDASNEELETGITGETRQWRKRVKKPVD